jgi:hypothetical protein
MAAAPMRLVTTSPCADCAQTAASMRLVLL